MSGSGPAASHKYAPVSSTVHLSNGESHASRPSIVSKLRASFSIQDAVLRNTIKNGLLILTWYILSTSLSLYNKQLVGKNHGMFGKGGFPAPLFMSGVQFACQTLIAKAVFAVGVFERTRTSKPRTWSEYGRSIVPNGVITGLDIGFSNKSLVFITMSFYTMCKATVPVFLLFFAFLWKIEKPSWGLAGVVCVIVTGLTLLVEGETQFDALGFALVMMASCFSGLRFTLTQVLLHGNHDTAAKAGPLELVEQLTPVMSITVLLLSLFWEQLWVSLPASAYFESAEHTLLTLLIVMIGAAIAFLMVWAEYQVIKETSALTFMIAGTCKEVVTVLAAVVVMGDHLGAINTVGLVIVIIGVLLFNWYKYQKLKAGEIPAHSNLTHDKDEEAALELEPMLHQTNSFDAVVSRNGAAGIEPISPRLPISKAMRDTDYEPLLPMPAGAIQHR